MKLWILGLAVVASLQALLCAAFMEKPPPICPPTEHICPITIYSTNTTDAVCYRAGTQICRDGLVCAPHEHRCGDACFHPGVSVCLEDFFICPHERSSLCGLSCYSPDQLTCLNGQLYITQ
jgi:hypothetical protein